MNSCNLGIVESVNENSENREVDVMARSDEHPEATLRDTLDHIPLVVAVLVLANVAAAAAIGRGTYNLVRRARGYVDKDESPTPPRATMIH